jgi:hypothetical protein
MKAILFAGARVLLVSYENELRRNIFKLSKIRKIYNFFISTSNLGSGKAGNESIYIRIILRRTDSGTGESLD